ncbi:hypothetical protein HY571_00385 [Candidatus Micrarchaeota archaeon]|nr:hypothetical protein [Candidatus Micrarchaeota archaeon]
MKRTVLFLSLFFIFLVNAQTPFHALEKVEKAAICTEIVQEGSYTRCVVIGGSSASLGGGDDGQLLNVTGVQRADGTVIPSENVVLEFRDSNIVFGDTAVRFHRFDSVIFNNSGINIANSLVFLNTSRFVNFTPGSNVASTSVLVDAFSIDLSADRVEASRIFLVAPFITASPDSEVTAGSLWLGDSCRICGIAPRASTGKINFLAKVEAPAVVDVFSPTADIRIAHINSDKISVIGKKVKLGTPTGQDYPHDKEIGHGLTNFTVVASDEVKLHSSWTVRARAINIYSTENINLYGDLKAVSSGAEFSGGRSNGSIFLSGEKNLYIRQASDVVAENRVSDLVYRSTDSRLNSISLSFPRGNVLINGRIDNKWDGGAPASQARINDINITAGHVYMQSNPEFKVDAAGRINLRAAGITLPNNAPEKIRGELALSTPTSERIRMVSCTLQYGGEESFRTNFWRLESSLCPDPVTLNIYGYLTNPGGQPFATGSARVNDIRVAVPNGVYMLNDAGENITSVHSNVFTSGFFSFALPQARLSPGAYLVNVTFSTSPEFSCETGACQDRIVIAHV